MNETNTATTATPDTTTAPFEVAPRHTAPPSFDELCEARAAAVELHRATLDALLPNLRTRLIAGCMMRAQKEACEKFSHAVFALEVFPDVAEELAAAGIAPGVAGDFAQSVLFGPNACGAVPGARRAAARDALARPLPEVARVLNKLRRA